MASCAFARACSKSAFLAGNFEQEMASSSSLSDQVAQEESAEEDRHRGAGRGAASVCEVSELEVRGELGEGAIALDTRGTLEGCADDMDTDTAVILMRGAESAENGAEGRATVKDTDEIESADTAVLLDAGQKENCDENEMAPAGEPDRSMAMDGCGEPDSYTEERNVLPLAEDEENSSSMNVSPPGGVTMEEVKKCEGSDSTACTDDQPQHVTPPIITIAPPMAPPTPVAESTAASASNGVGVVTCKGSTPSIYLSDGTEQEKEKPSEPRVPKRMTMVSLAP